MQLICGAVLGVLSGISLALQFSDIRLLQVHLIVLEMRSEFAALAGGLFLEIIRLWEALNQYLGLEPIRRSRSCFHVRIRG